MTVNILTAAAALSDHDLLTRLDVLASNEREASVQLVAHLAVLDGRPAAYATQGFGSLFSYCSKHCDSPRTPPAIGSRPPGSAGASPSCSTCWPPVP
jgi:hypothetical protein